MKKFLAWICMIACIFGLTACGEGESLSERETQRLERVQQTAAMQYAPLFLAYMDDAEAASFDDYTLDEISYIMSNSQINISGYVMKSAIESVHSAKEEMGAAVNIGEVTARVDGDKIIAEISIAGEKKDAVMEIIFSNDNFFVIESVSLNPVSSMGDLMTKAALNTVIGMGTVFTVLILISLIISCFGFIPAIQAKLAKKKPVETVAESTAAAETAQEEYVDETDDRELAAVIAAAVAACEGAASTDGFVVRSIRRRA